MAAALAGTAYVVKESEPDYAEKCLKYAKAIYEFGKKNVGNNTSGLSPFYDTEAQYQDEEAWANAWLWINGAADKPTRVPKDANYGDNQYDGWIYCWNKVWQGYAALMYKATGEQAFADELQTELKKHGDLTVGTYNADGWGASRYNCAKQMDALALAKGDPESSYAKAAKYQMDHILGDNSLGYSFLLGYGDKWPVHIHHRAANPGTDSTGASGNPSAKYTAYGLLVGGDDKSGYQDQTDKYQYTEGALDYNGCFAIACAGVANLYGGDATAMPALAKSASEINADFKFGSSTPVVTTTTTTTTATTTTVTTTVTTADVTLTYFDSQKFDSVDTYPTNTVYNTGDSFKAEDIKINVITRYSAVHASGKVTYIDKKETITYGVRPESVTLVNANGQEFKATEISTIPAGKYTAKYSGGVIGTNIELNDVEFDYEITIVGNSVTPGDANCDGQVDLADVVLIMQAMANPNKYGEKGADPTHITETGMANADVDTSSEGITVNDAMVLQLYLLHSIDKIPYFYSGK